MNNLRNFIKPGITVKCNIAADGSSNLSVSANNGAKKNGNVDQKSDTTVVPEVAVRQYKPSEWKLLCKAGISQKFIQLDKKRKCNGMEAEVAHEGRKVARVGTNKHQDDDYPSNSNKRE